EPEAAALLREAVAPVDLERRLGAVLRLPPSHEDLLRRRPRPQALLQRGGQAVEPQQLLLAADPADELELVRRPRPEDEATLRSGTDLDAARALRLEHGAGPPGAPAAAILEDLEGRRL